MTLDKFLLVIILIIYLISILSLNLIVYQLHHRISCLEEKIEKMSEHKAKHMKLYE